MLRPWDVELTVDERELYDMIVWERDERESLSSESCKRVLETVGKLTESLLTRKVIPKHRREWFVDPELNPGGQGKSRMAIYELNGTRGDAIFRLGNFVEALLYFIHGPRLPESSIQGLAKIVDEDAGTTGEVLKQITSFARRETRKIKETQLSESYKLPEEFLKLALELGIGRYATEVRSASKEGLRSR